MGSRTERKLSAAAARGIPMAAVVGYLRTRAGLVWVVLRCDHCGGSFALRRATVRRWSPGRPVPCPHCYLTTKLPEVK